MQTIKYGDLLVSIPTSYSKESVSIFYTENGYVNAIDFRFGSPAICISKNNHSIITILTEYGVFFSHSSNFEVITKHGNKRRKRS